MLTTKLEITMALPAGFPDQEWKYYDFSANWAEFLRHWKSDAVQDVLYRSMQAWCEERESIMPDGRKRTWKRGDPLWHMSCISDYWCTKTIAAAEEYIECNGCLAKFRRTMEQHGRIFHDRSSAWEAFHHVCWDSIFESMEPKPDTLESMIMDIGSVYLYNALYTAARKMFPDEDVAWTDKGTVLLPGRKLVFDFIEYYFDVVDHRGDKHLLRSDADYDCEVLDFMGY